MRVHVCFHGNCFDGFCAAWVVNLHFIQLAKDQDDNPGIHVSYHPMLYGEPLQAQINPGDRMVFVDFSLKRAEMITYSKIVGEDAILVLDHHKTAEAELEGLPFAQFDMEESGASLAWGHFFPKFEAPDLVKYIKDRDLWKWELPNSKAINSYIQSFPFTFDAYDNLHAEMNFDLIECVKKGMAIQQYQKTIVDLTCERAELRQIGMFLVPTVSSTLLFGEVGARLLEIYEAAPFAASHFYRGNGMVQWSLRSRPGFDCSAVAKQYGGGGHPQAAGFEMKQEPFVPIIGPVRKEL